ncbi:MAG: hypothetical protein AAF533_03435 [Acidobacteriota bacterium]
MSNWGWFYHYIKELRDQGEAGFAHRLGQLPSLACDDEHERLDALYPELLAASRERKHPWLEIFVRHWGLQSRVARRGLVGANLSEAVDLLERSSRDDARDCPQSTCVVQDLSIAYEQRDDLGFAAERLAVSSECLEQLDPRRECFKCIVAEKLSALADSDRVEEALTELDEAKDHAARHGGEIELTTTRVNLLIRLGRLAECLPLLDKKIAEGRGVSGLHGLNMNLLQRSRVLAGLGRLDEARRDLLAFEDVADTGTLLVRWSDAAFELWQRDGIDDVDLLDHRLGHAADWFGDSGQLRHRLRQLDRRAELALAAGHPATATLAIEDMESLRPELHRDAGAAERCDELRRRAEALAAPELPTDDAPPMELLSWETADASLLETLLHAVEYWPGHDELQVALGRALLQRSWPTAARARMEHFFERNPDSTAAFSFLCSALMATGELDEVERRARLLLESDDAERRALGRWQLANVFDRRGSSVDVRKQLLALLEDDPEALGPRHRLIQSQRRDGLLEDALAQVEVAIAQVERPGSWDWECMELATQLGRHELVRDSARRLDLTLSSDEGPIDEDWEDCRIRFRESDGTEVDLWARRRGPVTARIVQPKVGGGRERLDDLVVFDARPVNLDAIEEARRSDTDDGLGDPMPPAIYACLDTLERGDYRTVVLEGLHPGAATLDAWRDELDERDHLLTDRSGADYRVQLPDADDEQPGLYVSLSVREPDLAWTDEWLTRKAAELTTPLFWTQLLAALGDDSRRKEQEARATELGFELDP